MEDTTYSAQAEKTEKVKIERVSTREAAKILNVCCETVRRLHRSGLLVARLFPRGLMFDKACIEKLAAEGKDPAILRKQSNTVLSGVR